MRASNIIFLWTLHNVCNKNSPLFLFTRKLKTRFFLSAWLPFYFLKGPKLKCCNLPKSWKTQEKMKPTLYYGHYDRMTIIMVPLFFWEKWMLHAYQFCSNLSHSSFQCFWLNTNNNDHNNNFTLVVTTLSWHEEYKYTKSLSLSVD